MAEEVRVDKWLWAVRIYKTRSLAAEECKKGHISMNGVLLKPSRMLKVGDVVQVRKSQITYSYKILQAIDNRVSAKMLPELIEDVTPPEQLEILKMAAISGFVNRARGTGRPTKKDRRDLDSFFSQNDEANY